MTTIAAIDFLVDSEEIDNRRTTLSNTIIKHNSALNSTVYARYALTTNVELECVTHPGKVAAGLRAYETPLDTLDLPTVTSIAIVSKSSEAFNYSDEALLGDLLKKKNRDRERIVGVCA